ncbi:hypothetical protein BVRB_7g165040 [Beta vulgaris subsp. vulgaris]|uniref:Uncharacterized protein n=1 Tax=Beta vulgaris subsp. vulgaris TaxID=3555 RepID=A0A0J8C162_BETVV|nr:hypothetical protein BVRB_7g165040 [Beta vulgaris subsp. vulgaris]
MVRQEPTVELPHLLRSSGAYVFAEPVVVISFVRRVRTSLLNRSSSLNQSSSLKLGFGQQEPVVFGSSGASPRLQICVR